MFYIMMFKGCKKVSVAYNVMGTIIDCSEVLFRFTEVNRL